MIISFKDKRTRDLFEIGSSAHFPPDLFRRAVRRLDYLHLATSIRDLRVPHSNRLEALGGDRKGQYSIRVNDQWRLCFRFFEGEAHEVEICDYH